MRHLYNYTLFFLAFFLIETADAQSITGTWEGKMGNEYLRVSVEQKGNELCGFTYDYQLRDPDDHCIAAYVGQYDKSKDIYYISGRSFIANSGTHVLMRILMWRDDEIGKNALRATVYTSRMAAMLGMGGEEIILRKVSRIPVKLPGGLPDCFPRPVKPTTPLARPKPVPPVVAKPLPAKPVTPKPVPVKPAPVPAQPPVAKPAPAKPTPPKPRVTLPVKTDSVKKLSPPVVKARPETDLLRKMNERKQQQQSRLEINVKRINLKVYDNGVVDNDTVSIFYNGKLLVSHQRLSEQAIELNIDLDEKVTEHTITMFAENLGGIPPNTAVIIVTAGDKRYELRSKASLEENAVLIFEYRPRE